MDSLTQFVLGAGVGAAVLGPRIGPRKAVLIGGLVGTLPDLDVFFPHDDPVDSFTLHRGASHSFIVHAVVTPILGEALVRLFGKLRDQRPRTYLAVFLVLATHAALDALTVYGTRVFWPLFPDPVSIGSIFIIDPVYTLPLLVVTVWALCISAWTARFRHALTTALVVSTAYLGWSLTAQQMVEQRAARLIAASGIDVDQLRATPMPFSTLLWRVIALEGDHYLNLYVPVLGDDKAITAYMHPRGTGRIACLGNNEALRKLATFSDGYFRLDAVDGEILVSDLRMGLTPNYVFRFAVAETTPQGVTAIVPERRAVERSSAGDLDWLISSIFGTPTLRPAEMAAAADLAAPRQLAQGPAVTRPAC